MRILVFIMFFFTVFLCEASARAEMIVLASWYGGSRDLEGAPMANGEPFKADDKTTAAHPSLPLGTKMKVTYKGKSLNVIVKDRGPFVKGRKLDLSKAAADELGYTDEGVVRLQVTKVQKPKKHKKS